MLQTNIDQLINVFLICGRKQFQKKPKHQALSVTLLKPDWINNCEWSVAAPVCYQPAPIPLRIFCFVLQEHWNVLLY